MPNLAALVSSKKVNEEKKEFSVYSMKFQEIGKGAITHSDRDQSHLYFVCVLLI